MPVPDFPASPKPEYPIQETAAAPEVLVSTHRDGTEQRRLKGSGMGASYELRFGGSCPITQSDQQGFLDHWSATSGTLYSFDWTHPERGTVLTVRYLEAPVFTLVGYNAYTGVVKLRVVPA